MKTGVVVLAALLSTVQTVGWVECCCILICKHHNDPCKDECKDKDQAPASASECCQKPAPKAPAHDHDKRCSHVEPSSDVLALASDLQGIVPLLVADASVILAPILPVVGHRPDRPACDVRGSPPLLPLLGSLLI